MFLHDCVSKDSSETEIIIVEPGPLYKAAKVGRDRMTQAVIPIDASMNCRGSWDEMLDNDQCKALISSLGVGIQLKLGDLECFDLNQLRYGKLILVTSDSQAGIHIRNEVVLFLQTYMRPLADAGHIYTAVFDLRPGFTQAEFDTQVLGPQTRRLEAVSS